MRGGNAQKARYGRRGVSPAPRENHRSTTVAREIGRRTSTLAERREARMANRASVYRRRRFMAVGLLLSFMLALVFAVLVQTPEASESAVPIDPGNAGADTVLAKAADVEISTPIRPESLTGLGYHPQGESLVEMVPRGENLSANPLLDLFTGGTTPEKIHYYMMDAADRSGPQTGALDVGAGAGTTVYAPVTGMVTAIRPDPMMQGANVIEIKPDTNANVRVTVSLVRSTEDSAGVTTHVTAGMTELGTVADSAEILDPQLSSYTSDAGNHVTVSVPKVR